MPTGAVATETAKRPATTGCRRLLFAPLLAPLLADRKLTRILVGAALAYLLLAHIGLTVWQCPLQSALGLTCPACGLTRAMDLLLQGHWSSALGTHPFVPCYAGGLLITTLAAVLPRRGHRSLVAFVAGLEHRTAMVPLVTLAMLGRWGLGMAASLSG